MKPIGKITRDDYCTHSLVPYLFEKGHFKSKQEVLNDCIRARHGESIRTPQTLRQRTGDVLEKPLIQEFVQQGMNEKTSLNECKERLEQIFGDKLEERAVEEDSF